MNIFITRPNDLVAIKNSCTVVIDAIRATSTADVILSASTLDAFWAVPTPDDVKHVESTKDILVFSELSKETAGFNRVDNSPTIASTTNFQHCAPVLVTTNGTRAMDAALKLCEHVLLASIRNAEAVSCYLKEAGYSNINIVPSGDFKSNTPHIEDDVCANFIRSKLEGKDFDIDNQIQTIWDNERIQRRLTKTPDLRKDLDMCLLADVSDVCIKALKTPHPNVLKLVRIVKS